MGQFSTLARCYKGLPPINLHLPNALDDFFIAGAKFTASVYEGSSKWGIMSLVNTNMRKG